jgi:hypothetical protein
MTEFSKLYLYDHLLRCDSSVAGLDFAKLLTESGVSCIELTQDLPQDESFFAICHFERGSQLPNWLKARGSENHVVNKIVLVVTTERGFDAEDWEHRVYSSGSKFAVVFFARNVHAIKEPATLKSFLELDIDIAKLIAEKNWESVPEQLSRLLLPSRVAEYAHSLASLLSILLVVKCCDCELRGDSSSRLQATRDSLGLTKLTFPIALSDSIQKWIKRKQSWHTVTGHNLSEKLQREFGQSWKSNQFENVRKFAQILDSEVEQFAHDYAFYEIAANAYDEIGLLLKNE